MKEFLSMALASAAVMTLSVIVSSCSRSDKEDPKVFAKLTLEASRGEYGASSTARWRRYPVPTTMLWPRRR